MPVELLGIPAEIQKRAAAFAARFPQLARRFRGASPDFSHAKTHEITVDLKCGTRQIRTLEPVKAPKVERPKVVRRIPRRLFDAKRAVEGDLAEPVIRACAEAFYVVEDDVTGPSKQQRHTFPRFAAAKILADEYDFSLPALARVLKRRDHTTCMHSLTRAEELLEGNKEWARRYRNALNAVKAAARQ